MSDETKAIDYFSKKVKKLKENLEKGLYYGEQYQVREDIKHIETVLNLIKKQQAEIEQCKSNVKAKNERLLEYAEELEKKDKIIDLMALDIYGMQMECNRYFKDTEEVINKFERKIEQ